jgi:uncharacterized protein (TIGR03546 family)
MVLFVLKLLKKVYTAISERKHPKQLAAGVAAGLLLGLIPHGNLLAIGLLILMLCLKLNHAMMGVVAIGVTFLAGYMDPWSDQVGDYLLTDPRTLPIAQQIWALPMVPWTDLNNTIVLGSFLIGLGLVYPTYRLTLPLFNWIAPEDEDKDKPADQEQDDSAFEAAEQGDLKNSDGTHEATTATDDNADQQNSVAASTADDSELARDRLPSHQQMMAVRTRIDLIRTSEETASSEADSVPTDASQTDTPPDAASILERDHGGLSPKESLDESLEHLLIQLRDSQDKKAAG